MGTSIKPEFSVNIVDDYWHYLPMVSLPCDIPVAMTTTTKCSRMLLLCLHVMYLCSLVQVACNDLEDFATTHQKFVVYLETLTPYLQLRYIQVHLLRTCMPDYTVKPALPVMGSLSVVCVHHSAHLYNVPGGLSPSTIILYFVYFCSADHISYL